MLWFGLPTWKGDDDLFLRSMGVARDTNGTEY